MDIDSDSKVFHGVYFVLFGFNHVNEKRVRSKLINGGGIDVGQYGPSCTHVIVDKLVYDDPVCVAARNDGKFLLTGLWVDHSFDTQELGDTTSVLYRPLRKLNGIPGAKSFIMCLTGYQRQNRDDVMTMVGLMGAQFSKPLVAHKVTHLICYKFEGEKYDLAKKLRTIKLVNHRWLEDCLREWMLIPESNYNISGYDMEMLEAEAKDSEEEVDDGVMKHFGGSSRKSPSPLKFGLNSTSERSNTLSVLPNDPTHSVISKSSMSRAPTNNSEIVHIGKLDKHDAIEVHTCQKADILIDARCSWPSDNHMRTPGSEKLKVKNKLVSTPNAAMFPELHATSYSALCKSPLPLYSGEKLNYTDLSSNIVISELKDNVGFGISLAKMEQTKGATSSGYEQNLCREPDLACTRDRSEVVPLKINSDVSYDISKSSMTNEDCKSGTVNIPSLDENKLGLELEHFCLDNDGPSEGHGKKSQHKSITGEIPNSMKKPFACDLPFNKNTPSSTQCIVDDRKNTPQTPFQILERDITPGKPDILKYSDWTAGSVDEKTEDTDKLQQAVLATSESDKSTEANKLACSANVSSVVENDDSHAKPRRFKMFAKKSLSSRPKLGTANQKGPILLHKANSLNDSISVTHDNNEKCSSPLLTLSPQTVSIGVQKAAEATSVVNVHKYEAMDVDEKTEDLVNEGADFHQMNDKETSEAFQLVSDGDKIPKEAASEVQLNNSHALDVTIEPGEPVSIRNVQQDEFRGAGKLKTNVEIICPLEETATRKTCTKMKSKGPKYGKAPDKKNEIRGKKKSQLLASGFETKVHATSDDKSEKENKPMIAGDQSLNAGDICPLEETATRNSCTEMISEGHKDGKVSDKKTESKRKKKSQLLAAGYAEVNGILDKSDNENEPMAVGDQTGNHVEHCLFKPTAKSNVRSRKTTEKSTESSANPSMVVKEVLREVKTEPVCFILSGHRLQRKGFQQVIKRLKGRFCRDSHHWSYQATHFITPDPVRRTEKFFAAAASGRWILKPDYLTDCAQAGKLLNAEPYEWYNKGLTEDGAINLEAPRKWRLQRERTGHGAFYGMRIIIYGECIAPPLDTLKRAVKSGDGTILATSPPYTRFLNSGVDFAVVSPAMPRADLWIQEFLKYEIPCVAADYLVEYACKPGYPLEKHVLYNTHAWAEKSFSYLEGRAEEIVEDLSSPDDSSDNDDIACQECGCPDRAEVMLICGNEDGSNGCGVGMHIDCCNPPLLGIPDGDWFCPDCNSSRNGLNSPNKRKKGVLTKRK